MECYLPPGRADIPAFTAAEAGTRFSDPGGMQGGVDLRVEAMNSETSENQNSTPMVAFS